MLINESVFLLLTRDDGKAEKAFAQNGYALAAATLTDLLMAERIAVSDGKRPNVGVVSDQPTGYLSLDAALARVVQRNGKSLASLVTDGKVSVDREIAFGLRDQGIVDVVEKKALGFVPEKYPVINPAPENELRQRLQAVLIGATPTQPEAAILSILQGLDVARYVLKDEKGELSNRDLKARIKAAADEAGSDPEVSESLRKAVDSMNAAMMTTILVAAGTSAAAGSN